MRPQLSPLQNVWWKTKITNQLDHTIPTVRHNDGSIMVWEFILLRSYVEAIHRLQKTWDWILKIANMSSELQTMFRSSQWKS